MNTPYIAVSGRLRVVMAKADADREEGGESIVEEVGSGQSVGEIGLLAGNDFAQANRIIDIGYRSAQPAIAAWLESRKGVGY